ncbi:MAG: ferritin-like domain-containing protein [Chitinophagaceae bacterium]
MKSSQQWIDYFKLNSQQHRINWNQAPTITLDELKPILKSLQAWQLGESSEGKNLIKASTVYSKKIKDDKYITAVELFIKEEQKHGNNLGKYLDAIKQPRVNKDLGDTMFRKVRYFNTSMEFWTLAVITVESAAQVFYQCLKDATGCNLLKEICTDILIDEAPHIKFQKERMQIIFNAKPNLLKLASFYFYKLFFFSTSMIVWAAHKNLFKAGGINFKKYCIKMNSKYHKTLGKLIVSSKPLQQFNQLNIIPQ